jgi:hypothetical protein
MEMSRIINVFAGFMVMASLGLAHWMGQIDLSHASWLWLTLFVGLNVFQMGFTGFCPLVKILALFGYDKSKCCTPNKDGKSCC